MTPTADTLAEGARAHKKKKGGLRNFVLFFAGSIALLFVAVLALGAAGKSLPGRTFCKLYPCSPMADLEVICEEIQKSESETFTSPADKSRVITERISARLRTDEGTRAFQKLGLAPPDQKIAVWRKAIMDAGNADWSCPAVEKLFRGE